MALTLIVTPQSFTITSGSPKNITHNVTCTYAGLPVNGKIDYLIIDPGLVFAGTGLTTRSISITQTALSQDHPDTITLKANGGTPVTVNVRVTVTLKGNTANDSFTAKLT